jgi:RING finger protein 113A
MLVIPSRGYTDNSALLVINSMSVPFFRKTKSRPTTVRTRSASPPPDHRAQTTLVLPSRKPATGLLSAGTKRTTSQRDEDEPEKDGPDVKWTASGSHLNTALEIIAGDEVEELLAKRAKKDPADNDDDNAPDDGLYRGQQAYKTRIKKNQEVPKAVRIGPQRSTSTIRTVTIVDYQPDVCKDYKGESSSSQRLS